MRSRPGRSSLLGILFPARVANFRNVLPFVPFVPFAPPVSICQKKRNVLFPISVGSQSYPYDTDVDQPMVTPHPPVTSCPSLQLPGKQHSELLTARQCMGGSAIEAQLDRLLLFFFFFLVLCKHTCRHGIFEICVL